ncbi:MAG: GC-type dockerin domain-anchored protein [Phycisphaerales bacterium]
MLRLTLAVRGGLAPIVRSDGRDVAFVDERGAAVVNYDGLKVFDSTGAMLPARFDVGGADRQELVLTVDDAGAVYPVTIDPVAQQAYLKASNTEANDWFGSAVAVDGDTVVVGAPDEDSEATGVNGDQGGSSAQGAGAAYVFVRAAGGSHWIQQAYLKASNTGANDFFGSSVAISGDTIVVGAGSEDSGALGVNGDQGSNSVRDSGAAYVFVRAPGGATWSQQAYLKASNTGADDDFGLSVAISGDTIVVGAPYEDSNAVGVNGNQSNNSAPGSGAAYVFVRTPGGAAWSQQAYLKASNTGADDNFGLSVAISGDTILVGALREDSNALGVNGNQSNNSTTDSGAAYVFVRTPGGATWSQQAYLKASNTLQGDEFGVAVAISNETVIVGALYERSNATGVNGDQFNFDADVSGAAYVFVRAPGTASWSQQAYLKASNTGSGDLFGTSVAISGDSIVVGALLEDSAATGVNGDASNNNATDSGAAYVFGRIPGGTAWSPQAYVKASNTGAGDWFGRQVAISGGTVVVGAPFESSNATGVNGNQSNNSATLSGAAYVFAGLCDPPTITDQPDPATTCSGGTFQLSVAATGPNLSYQWKRDGVSITGATAAIYTKANATAADAGLYLCTVSSNGCSLDSSSVQVSLTAGTAPVINTQPQPQTVCVGNSILLSVGASGSNLTFQWRKDDVALPGATLPFYTPINAQVSQSGQYTVVVASGSCSVISAPALVSVIGPGAFTQQPQAASGCAGQAINFSALATAPGNPVISYTWQVSTSPQGTFTSLTTSPTNLVDCSNGVPGTARVTVNNSPNVGIIITLCENITTYYVRCLSTTQVCGGAVSNAATLTLSPAPIVTIQPQATSGCLGFPLTLRFQATGGLSQQWRKGGVNIPGATGTTLNIPIFTAADAGVYDAVITGTVCTAATNPATIKAAYCRPGDVFADSAAQFSGVQGQNGWSYGFYDGDPGVAFTAADFEPLPLFAAPPPPFGNSVDPFWHRDPLLFWTAVDAELMHPNGLAAGRTPQVNWAVRRWLCDRTAPVRFELYVEDIADFCGDGIVARATRNNDISFFTQAVPQRGENFATSVRCVQAGETYSFTTEPGTANNEQCDTFNYTVKIGSPFSLVPANASACPGETVNFAAKVEAQFITYQWRKNGVLIDTAVNPTAATSILTLTNVQAGAAGTYSCSATVCGTPLVTPTALLTVRPPTSIAQHPSPTTACGGAATNFTGSAAGATPFAYQWEVQLPGSGGIWTVLTDGQSAALGTISGATTPSLAITAPPTAADGTIVRLVASGGCGAAASSGALLTVCRVDINCDGLVNTSDLTQFLSFFGQAAPVGSDARSRDLNSDGAVNTNDLLLFLAGFGQACP